MSQATMSHDWLSKNFEMQYDGVQQLDQSNISQFAKKVPFLRKGNLGPVCPCLMIHSLRIYLKFCGMMRHQTKVALVTFPKKFLFWAIYTTNCSREFQKHSSMMWCNSQTLVRFVNFPEKLLFKTSVNSGKNGTMVQQTQVRPNLCNLIFA